MKATPLLFTAVSLLTVLALPASAQDTKTKKKPAAEKPAAEKKPESKEEKPAEKGEPELSKEQAVLKQALENHTRLNGYHVDVVIKTPAGNATLKGALGRGALKLDCTDVKGTKKTRIIIGEDFYLSEDEGKTWKKGDDADKPTTLLFNNIVTAPVQMKDGILQEKTFTAKQEKLNGEDVLHVEKPAKDKAAAVHFWLCIEPEMKNMVFVRKAELVISGEDLDLLATITYSKLTEPVKIEVPDAK